MLFEHKEYDQLVKLVEALVNDRSRDEKFYKTGLESAQQLYSWISGERKGGVGEESQIITELTKDLEEVVKMIDLEIDSALDVRDMKLHFHWVISKEKAVKVINQMKRDTESKWSIGNLTCSGDEESYKEISGKLTESMRTKANMPNHSEGYRTILKEEIKLLEEQIKLCTKKKSLLNNKLSRGDSI